MEQTPAGNASAWSPTSLYGYDLLNFVEGYRQHSQSAYDTAVYTLTHGGNYPLEHAVQSLGAYDRAAFDAFEQRRQLPIQAFSDALPGSHLVMYMNSLGRLHIRRPELSRPVYASNDQWVELGAIAVDADTLAEVDAAVALAEDDERAALNEVKRAMDRLHAQGGLTAAVERGIDSIQHIDNICFYVEDRFFALIERYANLIDTKGGKGCLSRLPTKPYEEWSTEELLIVAALHGLFLSGGAGRLEEFNGVVLSARQLVRKIQHFCGLYRTAGCTLQLNDGMDLFEVAAAVGDQARASVGKPWLRYRWIYGLNFHKVERLVPLDHVSDDADVHLAEFRQDYEEIVRQSHDVPEQLFFTELACACLGRDLAGIPCQRGSSAAGGWLEYVMERIVASAVRAVNADYGMSSSLRDISRLVEYDEAKRIAAVHSLTQYDFFTCFVTDNLRARMGSEPVEAMALAVQKRMMFNRWHFIPGNLERKRVAKNRHWFYPPSAPDIAAHANMHRAAHNRAHVKFSIRSPGPDLGRPPLQIAGQSYRGFFDVRVVRMDGNDGFTVNELLRVRRRSLWLECLYNVLVTYLQGANAERFVIKGFQPGSYLDMTDANGATGRSVTEASVLAPS